MKNSEVGDRVVYLDSVFGRVRTVVECFDQFGTNIMVKWDKGDVSHFTLPNIKLLLVQKPSKEIRVILHTVSGDVVTSFPEKCTSEARQLIDSYFNDKKKFSIDFC